MRRRDFITLLGCASASWPLLAREQQQAKIGFLSSRSPDESESVLSAFRKGLFSAGYIEGRNATVEFRWAHGQYDKLPALAMELVDRRVDIVAATGDIVSARAAKSATSDIPVVFVIGGDPVGLGLVGSLNRPDGNLTGVSLISSGLGAKRVGLLHELVPNAALISLLLNPNNPNAALERNDVELATRRLGLRISVEAAATIEDFEPAFAAMVQQRAGGLIVATDPFLLGRRDQLVALAARHGIPTIYQFREFSISGGLLSYGTNINGAYREAGEYAGWILSGEKQVNDLPIFQQTTLELVINMKAAKALGLNIPSSLVVFADELIE
jgi:putative tryptophan/tyrosine transport system substrate-binding protein